MDRDRYSKRYASNSTYRSSSFTRFTERDRYLSPSASLSGRHNPCSHIVLPDSPPFSRTSPALQDQFITSGSYRERDRIVELLSACRLYRVAHATSVEMLAIMPKSAPHRRDCATTASSPVTNPTSVPCHVPPRVSFKIAMRRIWDWIF